MLTVPVYTHTLAATTAAPDRLFEGPALDSAASAQTSRDGCSAAPTGWPARVLNVHHQSTRERGRCGVGGG